MGDLWSEVIAGFLGAVLYAGGSYFVRLPKRRALQALIKLQEQVTEHRNLSLAPSLENPSNWIDKAEELEKKVEVEAKKISEAAYALVHTLGEIEPHYDEITRWRSILTEIRRRIQKILESNL